jgi:predicted GIY-YIG superfamily endonuclease
VYFERYDASAPAIQREKNMKHWPRAWKFNLINSLNPQWRDLLPTSPGETHHGWPGQARP